MKKNINLKKGFLRLTIVLSIVAGISTALYMESYWVHISLREAVVSSICGFISVWIFYFSIKYIVNGFRR